MGVFGLITWFDLLFKLGMRFGCGSIWLCCFGVWRFALSIVVLVVACIVAVLCSDVESATEFGGLWLRAVCMVLCLWFLFVEIWVNLFGY